jgi:regulator of sigma E protease
MTFISQILIGLIGLGFLVFIHELGHFLVAKKNNVKVHTFSIGFGKKIFKWKRGETTYCISLIPFGGYVAMSGEHPGDDTEESDRDFGSQSIPVRAAIALGGPLVNIFFAFFLLWGLFWLGVPEYPEPKRVIGLVSEGSPAAKAGMKLGDTLIAFNEKSDFKFKEMVETIAVNIGLPQRFKIKRLDSIFSLEITPEERADFGIGFAGFAYALEPSVGQIMDVNSPAAKAGLQKGDVFLEANDMRLYSPQSLAEQIKKSQGSPIVLQIKRNEALLTKTLVPEFNEEHQRYMIGILFASPQKFIADYSFTQALSRSFSQSIEDALKPFYFIKKISQGQVKLKAMSGPVGIMQSIGYTVQNNKTLYESVMALFMFLALISMNLGIMNLLPLAITDGGILMFLGLEAIRGRPLSKAIQLKIQQIFLALFLTFFIYITFQDAIRIPLFLK